MRRKRNIWNVALSLMSISVLTSMPILSSNAFKDSESGSFTDPRDGQTYRYVQIGDQAWMAENLRYLPSVSGPGAGSTTTSYYYVYGYDGDDVNAAKDTENYQNYGALYNWDAAMGGASTSNSNPSEVQGACPPGWHVPSHAEWAQLIKHIENDGYFNSNWEMGSGNMLKSGNQVGSALGGTCNTAEHPRWESHDIHYGFDEYGFTALPGGKLQSFTAIFTDLGMTGYWWTTSEYTLSGAWNIRISYSNGKINRLINDKTSGLSLRCVRNKLP